MILVSVIAIFTLVGMPIKVDVVHLLIINDYKCIRNDSAAYGMQGSIDTINLFWALGIIKDIVGIAKAILFE